MAELMNKKKGILNRLKNQAKTVSSLLVNVAPSLINVAGGNIEFDLCKLQLSPIFEAGLTFKVRSALPQLLFNGFIKRLGAKENKGNDKDDEKCNEWVLIPEHEIPEHKIAKEWEKFVDLSEELETILAQEIGEIVTDVDSMLDRYLEDKEELVETETINQKPDAA